LQYYIGWSGWSYTSWEGPFYPSGTENFRWLNYYGLAEAKWEDKVEEEQREVDHAEDRQRTISDFLS
jgi:hypothetical protein